MVLGLSPEDARLFELQLEKERERRQNWLAEADE
jgi:hypothetical protein